MKIDTYDSPKLDILKDDILGLIHDVDDYKERIPEICTVLRNVQDTLAPGWFRNEVRKREDVAIKVYAAVSPADGIHRPMPDRHPASFDEADIRELIAGIEPETAAVDWACRRLPLPEYPRYNLDRWAFFVEAAPGVWVMFDDLPKELAKALLDQNFYELNMRPIRRPFSDEELAALVDEIKKIDPSTSVCDWSYAEFCDPYCLGDVPHVQVGRESFVRASTDRWVWFGDLPEETRRKLYDKHSGKLAFPAGLFPED